MVNSGRVSCGRNANCDEGEARDTERALMTVVRDSLTTGPGRATSLPGLCVVGGVDSPESLNRKLVLREGEVRNNTV